MYTLDNIREYRQTRGKKKIILDTNLLLLLLIGTCDKNFISKINCTSKYTVQDYELLLKIFIFFESEIVLTPHIVAEFSNLSLRDIKEPKIHYYLTVVLSKFKNYKEEYVALEKLLGIKVAILATYGFSDVSIVEAAKNIDAVILTDDIELGLYTDYCKIPNIKFGAVKANNLITSSV